MEHTFVEAPKLADMSSAEGPQALDSPQLPEYVPAPSQAEINVHMDLNPTKGVHITPEKPSDRAMELPQAPANPLRPQLSLPDDQFPAQTQQAQLFNDPRRHEKPYDRAMEIPQGPASPLRPQQLPLPDNQFPAQTQQARLFNDPRRHKLFEEYNEVIRQNPDSHLARLGELAHYVFDNGRPARVWTAGGVGSAQVGLDPLTTSIHGKCNCTYDESDILLLTESEHAAWSRANNPPKLVVIRDPVFSRRRPAKTTESWLREQEKKTHNKWVDVQRLNRMCNDGAAENIPLRDAIQQWRTSQNSHAISLETPPMNLLNISDKIMGHWPEGLAKDYQLLFEAIEECESMIYRSLDERLVPLSEQDRGIGKTTLMLFSHSDIQKCTQFRILAHRGACSSWHIDNAGVYTFIILEGNIDDPAEEAEDVVKYWPVYPTHHVNAEDEDAARLGFSREGINWRPKPKDKIPVIALTRGDMLIQPPGTIHAPITLTNCFFLGGMAWRKNTLPQTLNVWHYLMKNEICTNEPLPRQSQAILDFIRVAVHDAPEEHGYRRNELTKFDKICDDISGMVSKCGCSKACSLSTKCSCLMQGLKCGIRCHRGSTLHHTTCTTVNLLPPSSLERKKYTKRSRLKDDEDSDYTSNGTPISKIKRKKRTIEPLQMKAPNATLDAIVMMPDEHPNASPVVSYLDFTSNGTPSTKTPRKKAVEAPSVKALEATALVPNTSANNSPATANSVELKRPETCSGSPTGGTCEYDDTQVRIVCKHCGAVVDLGGEPIGLPRSRASRRSAGINENDDTTLTSVEKGAPPQKKCDLCSKTDMNLGNMRSGPNGPRTVCGTCGKKWSKERHKKEANNKAAAPAKLLSGIEKEAPRQQKCDLCPKTDLSPDKMRTGPNGPRTACATCAKKWSKERREKEANNEAVTPATLLPSIEKGEVHEKKCDFCDNDTITMDRRGPNGLGTLCGTCGKKWSKENPHKKSNNKGKSPTAMSAFDEGRMAKDSARGKKQEAQRKPCKSETPEMPRSRSNTPREDYCLPCKAIVTSNRWYNYEDFTGKGKRCRKCYEKQYYNDRRMSLVASETVLPSPARDNEEIVRTGIKFRLSPADLSAAKEHNTQKTDRSASQQDPPVQLQSGVLPPLFDAPPGLPQEDGVIYARRADLPIPTELPIAAKPQEPVQQELAVAYPQQHAEPQVLIDLQGFRSQEATPERSVDHKPEANGLTITKPEPQILPTLAKENAGLSFPQSLNLNTESKADADLPATNGSTTTDSPAENSNSYASSPLTPAGDGFSDLGDADLSMIS